MGTWALSQAQALVRQGIDVQVVSFTSWVPNAIALTPGAKAYAHCPPTHHWPGGVVAHYPRWLYYPVPPFKQWAYKTPTPYLTLAWQSAQRQLRQLMHQYQPDVVFCHHSLPNGWLITRLMAQLPRDQQRPVIILEHDFDEIADCSRYRDRRSAMHPVTTQASAWLAVSNRMATDMRSLFPHANVLTHHNGVDLPPTHLTQTPRPPDLQHKKVILACALFAERKGVPLLIKAFHHIVHHHPDAVLRIIGSGPEQDTIEQTISQLHLKQQVQLVGRKPHDEVLQEMAWADCFALVGWDEPFATVYLEAMAAGQPILCCQDGGIMDVIQHEVHGLTVPPKDRAATAIALNTLLSNNDQRQQWGKNAQQLIQRSLTWDAKATALIELFQQFQKSPNQPSSESPNQSSGTLPKPSPEKSPDQQLHTSRT
ncbi:MAG: glycosyltransferase family 4 protein [Merismopedia sp. SIO2A8]|nr:glycosyltransferase family 4 protein [Merismopedia sp. SIO2A8]